MVSMLGMVFSSFYVVVLGMQTILSVWFFSIYMGYSSVPKSILYLPAFFLLPIFSGLSADGITVVGGSILILSFVLSSALSYLFVSNKVIPESHNVVKYAYTSILSFYIKMLLAGFLFGGIYGFFLGIMFAGKLSFIVSPEVAISFIINNSHYMINAGSVIGGSFSGLFFGKSLFFTKLSLFD